MKKIDKFLEKALNKMFQAIGMEKWDKEFTSKQDWYQQKTWTVEQREAYKKWFLKEIRTDLKLTKTSAEKEWSWFHLMWSWKEQEQ
jgi:hypothetical protein